ncbi:MAG: DUF3486 family protein [Alphaproteobacteria bacterium]|nr:DUF3486 family protein [Alphaproteobacteria bacterium]
MAQLPAEIRAEADRMLVAQAFGGIDDVVAFLGGHGFEISRSSVHRHSQALERKIEAMRLATEQAKAIVAGAPDSEGAVSTATIRLAQERLFTLLNEADDGGSLKEVAGAARAIADMARASVSVSAERRKVKAEAADAADGVAKRRGLSGDDASAIRAAIEGLPA